MANVILFLKCKGCGKTKMLAEYDPELERGTWDSEAVSDWVGRHMECSPPFGKEGGRCFDLLTESAQQSSEQCSPPQQPGDARES